MLVKDCEECQRWPEPLDGYLPFGGPGEPLVFYVGPIVLRRGGVAELTENGKVTMDWGRRPRLLWSLCRAEELQQSWSAWRYRGPDDDATLRFQSMDGRRWPVRFGFTAHARGFLHGGDLGDAAAPLTRVIAHWVNVPPILRSGQVHRHWDDGSWASWPARWITTTGGWEITFDARQDLNEVYEQCKQDDSYAVTHVLQIRRADGSKFTANDVEPIVDGLQFAVSFALGHWAAPAMPVGYGEDEDVRWMQWAPLHCDRPKPMSGWWSRHKPIDLSRFVDRYLAQWLDPEARQYLRRATACAVLAVETGFVEQRLMVAVSALEMLSWIAEVEEAGMDERKWQRENTAWRIRRLMTTASVDIRLRRDQVELLQFSRENALGDGPAVIAELRHRLTHPKIAADHYNVEGLLGRAAGQACRYLELALLHRLGYQGTTMDRTNVERWDGDVDLVPWTARQPDEAL